MDDNSLVSGLGAADVAPADYEHAEILLTASEAYPALERVFLSARHEILGSFLVFDLSTELRSQEGRAIGKNWFDLIVHTLRRGVEIKLVVSDFDPVVRAALHRQAWHSVRMFQAALELAGPGAKGRLSAALHPSTAGWFPRFLIYPVILARLIRTAGWLNRLDWRYRLTALRDMPGVARRLRQMEGGLIRPRLWPIPRLFPATHHQKMAVIDGRKLYIGGMDLNERRFDDLAHERPAEETWHDLQLLLTGAIAQKAREHLLSFRAAAAGVERQPPSAPFLTTMSHHRNTGFAIGPSPKEDGVFQAHLQEIERAKRFIYLETQYFRDQRLARALAAAAKRNPDLRLILILPGAPEELAFEHREGVDSRFGEWLQAQSLRKIKRAFGARLFIGSAAQRRSSNENHIRARLSGAPLIYIHSKLSIFDHHSAIVSSANLNGRSMRWDTEAGVLLNDPRLVAQLRARCMAHWLPEHPAHAYFDDGTAVNFWRGLALSNSAKSPENREGFLLPYDLRAAERWGSPMPFLPEEMV